MCCGILINDYALQLEEAVVDGDQEEDNSTSNFSELLLRFSDYLEQPRRYER